METLTNAFISYGRADSKAFARKLGQHLTKSGLKAWFDFDDIPVGVDYQKQITDGIEKADNFLFVISPHSVNSDYCTVEIEQALAQGKRIVPLLQVEEISRDTWQQRHPQGTEEQWDAYQAAGKHTAYQNMHPAIAKINWIFFRKGIDDFDTSFQELLAVFERQWDYVRSHTILLTQASIWKRSQKDPQNLLVGNARQAAETWLTSRFELEQSPCEPTYLQCEFITESTKNANNLMTQVFIAYADAEAAEAEKIRFGLLRWGITVWSSRHDIGSGGDYRQAIERGIARADNIVFLISSQSLQSTDCQHELNYALSLNKRIIPILCDVGVEEKIPTQLQMLQSINRMECGSESANSADEPLLRSLNQDEGYYRDHKNFLVKALKWQQQQNNSSILLRGHDLQLAAAWLQTASQRELHPPTALQVAFIEASLRQPPDVSLDVFISYSRSDSECARKLNEALQIQGKKTWFDQESIAAGAADFEQEIYRGIEMSDNFVFILSPQSIASPYCDREVEYAACLNKRFITIRHQPVDTQVLHPELAKVQWIDFSQGSDHFYTGFNQLVRVLETDRAHVQQHTHLALQANQWQQKRCSSDLLLRGSELEAAQDWLRNAQQIHISPQPTELQTSYLQACETAHKSALETEQKRRRQLKSLLGLMTVAFVGAVGTSVYAFAQKARADNFLTDQIQLSSDLSSSLAKNGQAFAALRHATKASEIIANDATVDATTKAGVVDSLQNILMTIDTVNEVKAHKGDIVELAISSDSQMIATASNDGYVKLWDEEGQLINELKHDRGVERVIFTADDRLLITYDRGQTVRVWSVADGTQESKFEHDSEIWALAVSPDGKQIAIGDKHGQIQIRNLQGQRRQSLDNGGPIKGIQFSPDGQSLLSWDSDKTIKLWSRSGQLLHTFSYDLLQAAMFSPDSQTIAAHSESATVKLWSIEGTERHTLPAAARVSALAFSADSQTIAIATVDGSLQTWRVPDGQPQHTFEDTLSGSRTSAHKGQINSVHFEAHSQGWITASADATSKVWSPTGNKLNEFKHEAEVWKAAPSPDGRWSISYDNQYAFKISQLQSPKIMLNGHSQQAMRAIFSPDGQSIGTISKDGGLYLWNRQGHLVKKIIEESILLKDLQFSADGQLLFISDSDGVVKVIDKDGKLHSQMPHDEVVAWVHPSADGRLVATIEEGGRLNLWATAGELLDSRKEQYSPTFSYDSQMLLTASAADIYLWDVAGESPRLEPKRVLKGDSTAEISRRFNLSLDGNRILVAYDNGTARVWNFAGDLLHELPHGDGDVQVGDVAASADNQRIVTVGDNIAKLWSADGTLLKTLTDHEAEVFSVKFNPNGRSFATAANDQTVKIWDLDGNLLITLQHTEEIQRLQYSDNGKQLIVLHGNAPTVWNLTHQTFESLRQPIFEQPQWRIAGLQRLPFNNSVDISETALNLHLQALNQQACQWLKPYQANQIGFEQDLCKNFQQPKGDNL